MTFADLVPPGDPSNFNSSNIPDRISSNGIESHQVVPEDPSTFPLDPSDISLNRIISEIDNNLENLLVPESFFQAGTDLLSAHFHQNKHKPQYIRQFLLMYRSLFRHLGHVEEYERRRTLPTNAEIHPNLIYY